MFGWFKKRKPAPAAQAASTPAPASADESRPVSFVDAYGRTYQMPLAQWRRDILKPNLDAAWDAPDELYSLVLSALRDELAADVDEASARLVEIDPLVERSHTIRAIVQTKLQHLDEAGATLHAAMARTGESGVLLTNLAKVIAAKGDLAQAMATLDRALVLDPNQDNGLGWRLAELAEAEGAEAAETYLHQLAQRPDAWRPQLLLGQRAVQSGRREEALTWFDQVLARAPHGSDVLLLVSGELGKHGLLNDAVQRVAPLFDERRDDVRVGYNLLQAYLELGDAAAGRALLDRLFALAQPAFAEALQHYAHAFDEMTVQPPKPLDHEPKIAWMQLAQPVWLSGMHDMAWAMPPRGEGRPRVILLPLAAVDAVGQGGSSGREDERGRLSRALPLLLLEQLTYCSDLPAAFQLPVADGHILVLFGRPVGDEDLEHVGQGYDYAAEGEIAADGAGFTVVYRLRRLDDRSVVARVERRFDETEQGDALIAITGEMLAALGAAASTDIEPRTPLYALPGAHASEYVSAQGQALALTLACVSDARASLFRERNIYGWMQSLAAALPAHEPSQFLYFTSLAKGRCMGSPIVDEFERPATQRMRELVRAGSAASRLLPLLAAVYPGNEALGDLLASARPVEDEAYAAWCGRVAAAFKG